MNIKFNLKKEMSDNSQCKGGYSDIFSLGLINCSSA